MFKHERISTPQRQHFNLDCFDCVGNLQVQEGGRIVFKWQRDLDNGATTATCTKCGRVYDMASDWDRTNLDWHDHV